MDVRKLAVVSFAATAVVLAVLGGITTTHVDATGRPPANRSVATHIDPHLAAHFKILRRPRTIEDALPEPVFEIPTVLASIYGVNPDLSRRAVGAIVGGDAPLAGVWLVPGNNSLCVYVPQYSDPARFASSCAKSTKQAISSGDVGTIGGFGNLRRRLTLVRGVLPDDVKAVTIRRRSGSTVTVPVRDNVFLKVMSRPNRAFYTIDGHKHSQRLLAPCDSGRGVC